jgi:hypothetical protein
MRFNSGLKGLNFKMTSSCSAFTSYQIKATMCLLFSPVDGLSAAGRSQWVPEEMFSLSLRNYCLLGFSFITTNFFKCYTRYSWHLRNWNRVFYCHILDFLNVLFSGNLLLQLASLLHRLIIVYRQGLWQRNKDNEQSYNSYCNIYGGSKIILG